MLHNRMGIVLSVIGNRNRYSNGSKGWQPEDDARDGERRRSHTLEHTRTSTRGNWKIEEKHLAKGRVRQLIFSR